MSRSNVSCSFYCLTGSRPSIVWSSIHFREITVTCQSANGFLPRWQSVTLKYSEKPFERLGFIELLAVQTQLVDFYLQYWMHFGAFPCPRSFSRTPWVLGLLGLSVVSALISHLNRLLIVLSWRLARVGAACGEGEEKRTWRMEGVTGWGQHGALSSLYYENCIIWFVN